MTEARRQESPHTQAPRGVWKWIDTILFVFAIVVLKMALELHPSVRDWQAGTIATLQRRLGTFDDQHELKVVVFDISGIYPQQRGVPVTPRKPLSDLLDQFSGADFKPRAIAIDIDFSKEDGQYIDQGDPALFAKAKSLGIPVYFGVGRQAFAAPGQRLPRKRRAAPAEGTDGKTSVVEEVSANGWDELAVGVVRGTVAWRLPVISAGPEAHHPLLSMGERLAEHLSGQAPPHEYPHGTFFTSYSEAHYRKGHVTERTIDLSALAALRDSRVPVLTGTEATAVAMAGKRLDGAVVIIGDGVVTNAEDSVFVRGFGRQAVPGIYFHACAALTASHGDLFELTHLGRLVVDLGLSLLVIGIVALVCTTSHHDAAGRRIKPGAVHWFVTSLAVAAVILAGYWLVPFTRVLWIDFDLVALALVFHTPIEHFLHRLGQKISDVLHE